MKERIATAVLNAIIDLYESGVFYPPLSQVTKAMIDSGFGYAIRLHLLGEKNGPVTPDNIKYVERACGPAYVDAWLDGTILNAVIRLSNIKVTLNNFDISQLDDFIEIDDPAPFINQFIVEEVAYG